MKPNRMKIYFVLLIGLLHYASWGQNLNLRINEIIASNANGQMDDFFETDDWIEIYNPPGNPITNLAGYYISDDPLNLIKWQIPATNAGITTVLPNNFIVIWCDNDPEQGENHNGNFTLSAEGETVLLTAPDGTTIIDQVTYPQCAPDISYGRECDGCANWMFFNNVTFDDNNFEEHGSDDLFINEVQTQNISYFADLQGEYDQWFEIYNPNNFQVNVGGYYIGVNGDPLQWHIPSDNPYRTAIPALGYLLIWCDNDGADDTNHAPFTLNTGGATIQLTGPDGTTSIDSYTYTTMGNNQSYGRQNDGASNSILFNAPTPTVTNQLVFISSPVLYINEILTVNAFGITDNVGELEDWFEIYNPNNFDVNIGNYYFSDDIENPTKWRVPTDFPDSVTVEANSWLLFFADDDTEQGVRHAKFRLNNGQESLRFYTPDGFTVVDFVTWQGMDADTSLGRLTDGASEWVYFLETTPDASNNGAQISVVDLSQSDWTVYPNPAVEWIQFSAARNVRLYTAQGQIVQSGRQVQSMSVANLPAGTYLLVTDQKEHFRIVIAR
jgi:hypothetical protein